MEWSACCSVIIKWIVILYFICHEKKVLHFQSIVLKRILNISCIYYTSKITKPLDILVVNILTVVEPCSGTRLKLTICQPTVLTPNMWLQIIFPGSIDYIIGAVVCSCVDRTQCTPSISRITFFCNFRRASNNMGRRPLENSLIRLTLRSCNNCRNSWKSNVCACESSPCRMWSDSVCDTFERTAELLAKTQTHTFVFFSNGTVVESTAIYVSDKEG